MSEDIRRIGQLEAEIATLRAACKEKELVGDALIVENATLRAQLAEAQTKLDAWEKGREEIEAACEFVNQRYFSACTERDQARALARRLRMAFKNVSYAEKVQTLAAYDTESKTWGAKG